MKDWNWLTMIDRNGRVQWSGEFYPGFLSDGGMPHVGQAILGELDPEQNATLKRGEPITCGDVLILPAFVPLDTTPSDSALLPLSPDACAIIDIAVREYWVGAERDVETARSCESPERQAQPDSETFQAGRRMATAANLVTLLTAASGISVKVVVP